MVRNNLTTKINIEDGQDVEEDNNIIIEDPAEHFVDPGNHDLRLRETSSAVDTGSDELAPDLDRDAIPRPQGNGIDVGAYEYYEGDPVVPDAGAGGSSGSGGGSGGSSSGGTPGAGGSKNVPTNASVAGEDDGGCGCSTVGRGAGSSPAWLWMGVVAVLLFTVRWYPRGGGALKTRRAARAARTAESPTREHQTPRGRMARQRRRSRQGAQRFPTTRSGLLRALRSWLCSTPPQAIEGGIPAVPRRVHGLLPTPHPGRHDRRAEAGGDAPSRSITRIVVPRGLVCSTVMSPPCARARPSETASCVVEERRDRS